MNLGFIQFLNRKYPFHHINVISIGVISFSIGFFLFILQPFGLVNSKGNKIILCVGFAVVTFFALLLTNGIKKYFLRKRITKWTILKEFIFLNFVILTITIGNYFYMVSISNNFVISISNFISTLFFTFTIGIIPVAFVTLYRYNNFKNNYFGKLINDSDNNNTDDTIKFNSLNKADKQVVIQKKHFLYAEVVKNNINVFYYEDNVVKSQSIRNTLKSIEDKLEQDKTLFRCHRSFIVNTHNIKTAKGNSNGYKIYFNNYNGFVPVSRSYAKKFKDLTD